MGTLASIGIGIPFGSFDSLGAILSESGFYAPLKSTLVLTRGTGNPTYTRATAAWEFDNEGKLITVPSGGARFGGGRMVQNGFGVLSTPSEDFSHVLWVKIGTATVTGTNTINLPAMNDGVDARAFTHNPAGKTYRAQVELSGSGTTYIALRDAGGSSAYLVQQLVTLTATPTVYTCIGTSTDSASPGIDFYIRRFGAATATSVVASKVQVENVTGQADQTASEYVSAGVLSAPYHGAGVDGVKWFETNKNGSAISEASLLGYHAEGARTNSLLYSRNLIGNGLAWVTSTTGSEICTNGTFTTSADWVLPSGATISGGTLNFNTSGYTDPYINTTTTTGKAYIVTFNVTSYTSGVISIYIKGGAAVTTSTGTGVKTAYLVAGSSGNDRFYIICGNGSIFSIDDLSIKEAAIQVTTCTGIDNAANSASTLTAGAADATILQTLSLAAAARSSSAYVKRRTGSGNIYMTRDGGTNWTDITASVGSSWTRVKIENTSVLNPSIGFKIATSGDEIDVDVCQDEAGAFISSPIITTTAAVTRNADALYYAAANIRDTQGSILFTQKLETLGNTGSVAALATELAGNVSPVYKGNAGTLLSSADSSPRVGTLPWTTSIQTEKAAISWTTSPSRRCLTLNSTTQEIINSYDGSWNATALYVGYAGVGVAVLYGYAKNVYIWSTALTDAQLQQVTA